ncbi:hypothetical protein ZHAS_00012037 [Anopheles sinensis]|uniref:Uncharacterized protein n=1 Tax=Anopheles sinensis TaxID=74873 RepID=A0A084W216_ANOSI|nr:hypothetical protein ZHAS_00012037 [Anopheles sinensis]
MQSIDTLLLRKKSLPNASETLTIGGDGLSESGMLETVEDSCTNIMIRRVNDRMIALPLHNAAQNRWGEKKRESSISGKVTNPISDLHENVLQLCDRLHRSHAIATMHHVGSGQLIENHKTLSPDAGPCTATTQRTTEWAPRIGLNFCSARHPSG